MSVLCRPDGSISFSVSESLLNTSLTQGDIIVFYNRPEGLEFIKEYDCDGFLEYNFLNLLSSINISAIIKEIHFDSNHLEVIFISGLEKVSSLLGINNLSFFCPRLNQVYYLSSTLKETCFLSSRNNIWEKRSIYGSPISPNFKVGSGKYNFDNCNFYSFGFEGHENPSTSHNNKYVLISNQHVVYSSLDPISFLDGNLFRDQFTCEYDEIYSNSKRENILKRGIYFGQFVFPFEEYSDSNIRSFLNYIKKYQPSLYQNVYDNNTTLSDRIDFFKKLFAPKIVKFYSPKLKRYITRKIVMSLPAENYYREKYGIDHGISGVCVGLLDNPISIYETGIKPVAFHSEESSYLNFSENREVFYFDNYLRLSFAVPSNNFGVFKTKNDMSLMKSKYVDMYDEFGSSYFGDLDIGNIVMCKGKSQSIIIGLCNGIENFQGIKGVKSNEICVNFGSDVKVKEFFGNAFKVPNRADPFILYGKSSYGDASSKFDFYRESYLECKNYNIFNQEYMYNFLSDFDYWKINSISEIWDQAFDIPNIHMETDVMEYSTGSRSPVTQRSSSVVAVVSDENYASISQGYSGVIFYTTRDGTVKYIAGYNADPSLPESERNVIGAGIRNITPFSTPYGSFLAGQGGVDLTPPSDLPKCKQVVTGYRNAHALTVNDSIVSWDGTPNQQWKKTSEFFMQQLRYYQEPGRRLEGVKIKKISSGAGFVAVLLTNGEVITYGANESAQMSDVDTVLTPIGIIPLPVRGDNFYVKKWKPYKTWKYGENLSTYLDSLSSPNSCVTQQEINEDADDDFPDVDSGTNSNWRLYRSAALGCEQHEGSGAISDSPYIKGSTIYPSPPASWSGFLDWSSLTGAPNDYQFSRSTTGDASSVNFSFGASWTRSPDRIPMTVVYSCTTEPDGECSYVSNGYERPEGHPLENDRPPNSLFGFSGNRYRDVSCSRTSIILMTENGNLESWGMNFYYNVTGSGPQFGAFSRTGSGIPGGNPNDGGWSTPGHPRPFPDAPWGDNSAVEVKRLKTTPESLLGVGAGYYISIVIRTDGSIFAWDRNEWGESLPRFNSDDTFGLPSGIFKQVDGGYHHSIALREDGTVVCWGENNDGECDVPSILKNPITSKCVWVCALSRMSFALRDNGDLIGWGNTDEAAFGFKGFTPGSVFNPGEPILLTFVDPSSSSSSSSSSSFSSSSSSSSDLTEGYIVTSSLPGRDSSLAELNIIIPGLVQNNIKYSHTLYSSDVDASSWLSDDPLCCDVNLTVFGQKVQEHISSWSSMNTEYNFYYGAPEYVVLNQLHTFGVPVELQEILTVEEDITSGRGLRAFNMLTGLLDTTKSVLPQSNVSQYSYPYLPYFFLPRPDGGDACTWSSRWAGLSLEDYENEKDRLTNLLKNKVASFVPHTDTITTAHYPTYSERQAVLYPGIEASTFEWVLNNCRSIIEASQGKPVNVYVSPVIFAGSEYTLESVRQNNFTLPLSQLKSNIEALPKLVVSTPYMERVIFKPMRQAGVKRMHMWMEWRYTHNIARLLPSGSSTFGITDADIYLSRKMINDLFIDQNFRSPIDLSDDSLWNSPSTREEVIRSALSKDIEMANSFRSDGVDGNENAVWAYCWNAPDSTDVNKFERVKPMIWVSGGQRYDIDPRPTIGELSVVVSRLNQLPPGKRTLGLMRYNSSAIWNNSSDFLLGQFKSPWPDNELENMKNDWQSILGDLQSLGAAIDFVSIDNEGQFSAGPAWYDPASSTNLSWIEAIKNDPRYNQSWKGFSSLSSKISPFNIDQIFTPGSTDDYIGYWRGLGHLGAAALNYAIWEPLTAIYPSVGGSNYQGKFIVYGDSFPDPNGHEFAFDNIFGTSASPSLYGSWKNIPPPSGPGSRVISPSDPTHIIRWNGSDPETTSSPWLAFLIDIQSVRACKRSNEQLQDEPDIEPWIASVSWFGDTAYNYEYKNNKSYYYEMIRHAVLNGAQRFAVWNPFESSSTNSGFLDDVLRDINSKILSATKNVMITERISYISEYLISGVRRHDGDYIWRITPKPGVNLTISGGTELFDTSSNGGFVNVGRWFLTSSSSPPSVFVGSSSSSSSSSSSVSSSSSASSSSSVSSSSSSSGDSSGSSSSSNSSSSSSSNSSSSSLLSSSSSISSSSSSSLYIEYDPYSGPQPRSTVVQIESDEPSFVNEEFGINYFKGVFGGAVYDSVEINFRDIVKVMAKADSINGIIKFIGNTKFAKYDKLTISLSSVSHNNSGDVDHITIEDSFEGVNAGLPSLLSRVVHSNINVSSAFIVSSEFGSDFEGFQSFIVSNNDPNKISYDTSDFNKKQLFASSEFSVNENFINSMLFDEEQNSVLLGGKFGVYKFSLDSKDLVYDVRFMGSADCINILQTSVEIIAVCSGGIYVYNKYSNSSYVINLMGFPFKVFGGFITSKNDLAVLTSGGIFIKNKDANQIIPVLQDIVSSSSSSGQSSSSSNSSSSSSYSNFVSFYKGIGYQINMAFTDKNLYYSGQISQWAKSEGVLPSTSISDVVIFGNNLYICTSSGLYVNKLSEIFTLNFKKVILDGNNQNLSINALGASYSFNDEGARVDQLMLAGDEKGKIYSIVINNDEQVTSTVQTEFSVIHKVLRVEDDWILSSYNQFKLLSNDKIYTLSLGVDV